MPSASRNGGGSGRRELGRGISKKRCSGPLGVAVNATLVGSSILQNVETCRNCAPVRAYRHQRGRTAQSTNCLRILTKTNRMGYTPPRSTPPRSRRRSSGMGRRRGHGVGDRPNGRRAGIRRDVLASNVNQASSCLPPPVPRGGMQRSRCPPQPGRPPPARWPSVSGGRRKRQVRPSRERYPRTPSACTRHARAPAVSLSVLQRRETCVRNSCSAAPCSAERQENGPHHAPFRRAVPIRSRSNQEETDDEETGFRGDRRQHGACRAQPGDGGRGLRPPAGIVAPTAIAARTADPAFGPGPVVIGSYYPNRGYWDGHRYWHHRDRWHGGWRYR